VDWSPDWTLSPSTSVLLASVVPTLVDTVGVIVDETVGVGIGVDVDAFAWLVIKRKLVNAAMPEAAIANLRLLFIWCLPFAGVIDERWSLSRSEVCSGALEATV
jgi:hypothetical protein